MQILSPHTSPVHSKNPQNKTPQHKTLQPLSPSRDDTDAIAQQLTFLLRDQCHEPTVKNAKYANQLVSYLVKTIGIDEKSRDILCQNMNFRLNEGKYVLSFDKERILTTEYNCNQIPKFMILCPKERFYFLGSSTAQSAINHQDRQGNTALHRAILHKNTELLPHLLKAQQIDVNTGNRQGNTALHFAVQTQQLEMVQALMQKGAKSNLLNHAEKTAYTLAKKSNNADIIDLMPPPDERPQKKRYMGILNFLRR